MRQHAIWYVLALVAMVGQFHEKRLLAQDLLATAVEAHRASRESIQTLYCRVDLDVTILDPAKPEGGQARVQSSKSRFWYSRDALRVKVKDANEDLDYLWKDSVRTAIITRQFDGRTNVAAHRGGYADRHLHRADAFRCALLAVNIPGTTRFVPVETLVGLASHVDSGEERIVDGRKLVFAHLTFNKSEARNDDWNVELYFDPEVNYLLRRVTYITSGGEKPLRREDHAQDFDEIDPTIYFPTRIVGTVEYGGTPWSSHIATLLDVDINSVIADELFRVRFPHGIYVTDTIERVSYRVDANGNRISPAVPLSSGPLPPALGEVGHSETIVEPGGVVRWLFPVSLAIFVLGFVALIYQRLRRPRQDD